MIFDGPDAFPKSCVLFAWFRAFQLREMFAYLREKEQLFQHEIEKHRGTVAEQVYRHKLEEVEAHLIWMAHNVASEPPPTPRKRRKPGDRPQPVGIQQELLLEEHHGKAA